MWVGIIFISIAILWFVAKLLVSYDSEGGSIGMVPVLDGAIFPPLCATFGFVLIRFARRIGTGDWVYFLVWFLTTIFAFWAIVYAGNLGRRNSKKDS